MRVKLKRVLSFVAAVVICGVSCVTSWFSVPVSAIGVFSPFNFYQLYQMLHGLLLGDGGGNSQTFGEWLEKNMTSTIGSGNDKTTFLITPGMKLDDMISEASMRLMLGAACTDGGAAGISKMKKLIDSWTEVYDSAGDVGSWSPSGGWICDGWKTASGMASFSSVVDYPTIDGEGYFSIYPYNKIFDNPYVVARIKSTYDATDEGLALFTMPADTTFYRPTAWYSNNDKNRCAWGSRNGYQLIDSHQSSGTLYLLSDLPEDFSPWSSCIITKDDYYKLCSDWGLSTVYDSFSAALVAIAKADWKSGSTGSDAFIGPVYAMPAAKQLVTDTGTLSGLRLDVQTEDGTPDISAALDHAGVESVDDLVSGVAAGTIPMSQVYEDMRVVPYVLTDVETGQVVTDLNVSATDAKTKAVALDKTLSIPKDVSAADAYQVTGKTWDPEMSKYKLPLFQFFPFCLPWDIYEVLTLFDAEPVAPKFTIPVGQFFTRFSGSVDTSKAADQKAVVDLGSDSWQSTFKVIRALECAAIIIGLCLTAVLLIHGGR